MVCPGVRIDRQKGVVDATVLTTQRTLSTTPEGVRVANSRVEFTVDASADGDAIEDALNDKEGVQLASFDPDTGVVEVRHGEELISGEAIKSTVRELGYDIQ